MHVVPFNTEPSFRVVDGIQQPQEPSGFLQPASKAFLKTFYRHFSRLFTRFDLRSQMITFEWAKFE